MTAQVRLDSLRHKHEDLDTRLHDEEGRPNPDPVILSQLKKQKLWVKDEMNRLSDQVG